MLKFLLLICFTIPAFAQTLCSSDLATMPTRAGGRVKPLMVLAHESLKFVTGSTKLNDMDGVEIFCKLSFEGLGIKSNIDLPVKIEHVEVKTLLQMNLDDTTMLHSKLSVMSDELRQAHGTQKENNSYKKELSKVLSRLQVIDQIKAGLTWTLPEINNGKVEWLPLTDFITEPKVAALKQKTNDPFALLYEQTRADYIKAENDTFMLEYQYQKANLFLWSLLLGVLALALSFGLKGNRAALIVAGIVILLEVTGMTMRVLISGRAPITNMYETVLFSGLGALILGFVLCIWKKEKSFLIGGLVYNVLCLMMMRFANNMLDSSISPLVPVLRDNFWLSTHVTTIILSYAALALSWILANVVLARQLFKSATPQETRFQMEQIYTCIKVGVVLLSAGIILGGIWADYSWGRFWGWDPKETWSLIVLLIYMAILHGRYTSWITPARFVPLAAGAFMSVMMAWFGVNYILATGLHSYGFSEGGAIFLGSFFLIQTGFLVISVIKNRKSL
jgi:cytochrome c-type biogenesis protein CcsB